MPTDIFIALLFLGALAAWVFLLGPLYVAWCFYRAHRLSKGFRAFCHAVGAKGEPVDKLRSRTVGDYRVQLLYLSEATREVFSEGPLSMPATVLRHYPYFGTSATDRRAEFLEEFPYKPIDIKRGPVLALVASCGLDEPFDITLRSKIFTRPGSEDILFEDVKFDRLVSVHSANRIFIKRYLTAQRRSAIVELFELGFKQLLYVRRTNSLILVSGSSFLWQQAYADVGPRLLELFATFLPGNSPLAPETSIEQNAFIVSRNSRIKSSHALKVSAAFLMAFFAIYIFGHLDAIQLVNSEHFVLVQVLVSALLVVLLAPIFAWLTGRPQIWRIVLPLPILFAIPFATARAIVLLNRCMDQSRAESITATIGNISTHVLLKGRHSRKLFETHYVVGLTFIDRQGQQRYTSIEVSQDFAERVRAAQGAQCKISIRAGAFGFQYATGAISLLP